jgi:hypothetical protein
MIGGRYMQTQASSTEDDCSNDSVNVQQIPHEDVSDEQQREQIVT